MYFRLNSIEVDVARTGWFFKFGKTQGWIDLRGDFKLKPEVKTNREHKELEVWWLGAYAVLDRSSRA